MAAAATGSLYVAMTVEYLAVYSVGPALMACQG